MKQLKCDLQPKAYCLDPVIKESLTVLSPQMDTQMLLQSEILHNEVLKRQCKELEMQLDLTNIKLIVSHHFIYFTSLVSTLKIQILRI